MSFIHAMWIRKAPTKNKQSMICREIFFEIGDIGWLFVIDIYDFYESFKVLFSENVFYEHEKMCVRKTIIYHYDDMLTLVGKPFQLLKFSDEFFFCFLDIPLGGYFIVIMNILFF